MKNTTFLLLALLVLALIAIALLWTDNGRVRANLNDTNNQLAAYKVHAGAIEIERDMALEAFKRQQDDNARMRGELNDKQSELATAMQKIENSAYMYTVCPIDIYNVLRGIKPATTDDNAAIGVSDSNS